MTGRLPANADVDDASQAIAAVRAGDAEAYARVVAAHDDALRGFLARRCPDAATLEEVWHDAFVTAYRRLAAFDPARATFGAWVKGIARNLLARRLRERARAPRAAERLAWGLAARALDQAEDEDPDLEALRRCLARLPAERQALVERRYRDGLAVETLAAELGRTATWVTTTLQRVRDALRACLRGAVGERT